MDFGLLLASAPKLAINLTINNTEAELPKLERICIGTKEWLSHKA